VLADPAFLPFLLESYPDQYHMMRVAGLCVPGGEKSRGELVVSVSPSAVHKAAHKGFARGDFGARIRPPSHDLKALARSMHLAVLQVAYVPFLVARSYEHARGAAELWRELPDKLPDRVSLHRKAAVPAPVVIAEEEDAAIIVTSFVFNGPGGFSGAVTNACATPLPPSYPAFVEPPLNLDAADIVDVLIPDVSLPSGFW
jgi:hypothetical protein